MSTNNRGQVVNQDDTWFEDLLNKLYGDLFDPNSGIYLPGIVQNGYHNEDLGINVEPWKSVSLPDISNVRSEKPLFGGCGFDTLDGNVSFSGANNMATNFSSIEPAAGQALQFSAEDSVVQVPFSFSSVIVNGDLSLTQGCKDCKGNQYQKTYTGTYAVTVNSPTIIATVTLKLGKPISGTVHPIILAFPSIDLLQPNATPPVLPPDIVITGSINDPPPNIETWWIELANSTIITEQIKSALSDGLGGPDTERWVESVINAMLAKIPT